MPTMNDRERPTLQFLGAAGTVTGAKHLIRAGDTQVLLDCGLFQGLKALRLRNWRELPVDARALSAVVLSHAHVDHSGALPLLVRQGFKGPIYCTPGTADLLSVLLLDAAKLQEEEAEFANRHGYAKHRPALPLYTVEDAVRALKLLAPRRRGTDFAVARGVTARFRHAGHILGAATVQLDLATPSPCRLVYSGDLGRWQRPILCDPELVDLADVVLVESTYGDRVHAPDPAAGLARIVRDTAARGGVLIVPAFAVGRTQELIWTLRELEDAKQIPVLPVYVDSPMASNVTEIYSRHPEDHDVQTRILADAGRALSSNDFHLVRSVPDSRDLLSRKGARIVIAGSGMATGGRVLHHLRRHLPDERATVLVSGYQAAGTRGRKLLDGATTLRMFGEDVPVRCHVEVLGGFSAHADRDDLLRWLRGFTRAPRRLHVVHGEPAAAESLAALVRTELRWDVEVAADGAEVVL
jgi:metallo-beta-lactamase family protein